MHAWKLRSLYDLTAVNNAAVDRLLQILVWGTGFILGVGTAAVYSHSFYNSLKKKVHPVVHNGYPHLHSTNSMCVLFPPHSHQSLLSFLICILYVCVYIFIVHGTVSHKDTFTQVYIICWLGPNPSTPSFHPIALTIVSFISLSISLLLLCHICINDFLCLHSI